MVFAKEFENFFGFGGLCEGGVAAQIAEYDNDLASMAELKPNFGDGLKDQAAAWARGAAELPMTSIPSVNLTPWISFGNWLWPSMRRQFLCAPSTSLKTMASAVLFDRQPFDRMVRCRTVAKVLSMGFVVRKCFQCSAGKS